MLTSVPMASTKQTPSEQISLITQALPSMQASSSVQASSTKQTPSIGRKSSTEQEPVSVQSSFPEQTMSTEQELSTQQESYTEQGTSLQALPNAQASFVEQAVQQSSITRGSIPSTAASIHGSDSDRISSNVQSLMKMSTFMTLSEGKKRTSRPDRIGMKTC